jgi:YesN/AraC family two-component response regulator
MRLLSESSGRVRSVSVFANMLHVTPKYLSKCVKEESGRSPLDHIHETTVNTIRQQLRYSNKTVKEICTELEFPNESFFGRFVKKYLGCTPREYRNKMRRTSTH